VNTREQLEEELRAVRQHYDKLRRGRSAAIRHCKSADELALEAVYWEVGGGVAHERRDLTHVVLLFPIAGQGGASTGRFSFGRFLRKKLGDGDSAALRFRRLLASNDRDELDHRLRGVLRLACADRSPVDWGSLGADLLWFFAENNSVRRRWAQDFYAPLPAHLTPSEP
jgi:CRISPR type I-E-associated protein CasB/Cse2